MLFYFGFSHYIQRQTLYSWTRNTHRNIIALRHASQHSTLDGALGVLVELYQLFIPCIIRKLKELLQNVITSKLAPSSLTFWTFSEARAIADNQFVEQKVLFVIRLVSFACLLKCVKIWSQYKQKLHRPHFGTGTPASLCPEISNLPYLVDRNSLFPN